MISLKSENELIIPELENKEDFDIISSKSDTDYIANNNDISLETFLK